MPTIKKIISWSLAFVFAMMVPRAVPVFAQGLSVGNISPTTGTTVSPTMYMVTYNDTVPLSSCSLIVDGTSQGALTLSSNTTSGTATIGYIFPDISPHQAEVSCTDSAGFTATSPVVTITAINNAATNNSTSTPPTSTYVPVPPIPFSTNTTTTMTPTNSSTTSTGTSQDIMPTVFDLQSLANDASMIMTLSTQSDFAQTNNMPCELSDDTASTRVAALFGTIANSTEQTVIQNFMACGTPSTLRLGAGERLGVVDSFWEAYGHLPSSQADWNDVVKIANGRFPTMTSSSAEATAKTNFRVIYGRSADTTMTADMNAVTIMAYGLRPMPRNLHSEAAAAGSFEAAFNRTPTSGRDWDIVRAIAYSGATRTTSTTNIHAMTPSPSSTNTAPSSHGTGTNTTPTTY